MARGWEVGGSWVGSWEVGGNEKGHMMVKLLVLGIHATPNKLWPSWHHAPASPWDLW